MAFFTDFDLNTICPVASSITDSMIADGSELGANSGKLIYSPDLAANIVFLEIRAPLGKAIGNSKEGFIPCWLAREAPSSAAGRGNG